MGLGVKVKELHMRHIPDSSVSLELKPGDIVGLTGMNGAGKTELLQYLAGLKRTGKMGEIVMDGLDPFHVRDLDNLRGKIGLLCQQPEKTMVFSGLASDAAFGPENLAVEPEVIRKRWEGLRKKLLEGIPEDQDFRMLSGGQQQRAALVSVLMMRPQLLLLDEPLSMLGRSEGQEVLSLILSLARRNGQTLLLVSHDPETLGRMKRVLVLKNGRITERKAHAYGKMTLRKSENDPTDPEAGPLFPEDPEEDPSEETGRSGLENPFIGGGRKGPSWIIRKEPEDRKILLSLLDVGFRYGRNHVVEHFTAEICAGGLYLLRGGTGSGKSTLCKLMNGTLSHHSGHIRVGGMELPVSGRKVKWSLFSKKKPAAMAPVRRYVGYAMQFPEDQLFETSVHLDVMYGPMKAGRPTAMARQDAEDALRALKVPERLWERNPERLSEGEKRRVAIAGILAMKPQVLILDEPFAGMDREGRRVLEIVIDDYVNQGKAVVITAHEGGSKWKSQ